MQPTSIFVTGTDTGIGKTYVACKLIEQYVAQGYKVVGMKPVAAGTELIDGKWVNEDVHLLKQASNIDAADHLINPYCFKAPIAPHIAAAQENENIHLNVIKEAYNALSELADIVVVEGAGGWLVPINSTQTMAEIPKLLNLPVIIVIGMQLGCINHASLTLNAVNMSELSVAGWVVNNPFSEEMLNFQENVACLQQIYAGIEPLTLLNG